MLITGDDSVVDALLFGVPSAANQGFIRNEINRFANSAVGEFGTMMAGKMRNLYESFHSSAAMNMMQAALNQARALVMPDTIYRFNRIEDFQIAQPQMQTYIMANPIARALYHAQQCDGYSDSYVDQYPGKIGANHVHYQQVTNGQVAEEGPEGITWTNYSGAFDAASGELVLRDAQQHAVRASWRELERLIAMGEYDPTSPWNTRL